MSIVNKIRNRRWLFIERRKLASKIRQMSKKGAVKLNVGSGNLNYTSWLNLNLPFFDLRNKKLWSQLMGGNRFDNIVLEHVLEHLTVDEVKVTLSNAKNFMTSTSIIRIAVPDKFHPSKDYIEYVRPNGTGPGCDDHKSFWSYKDFTTLIESLNLKISLLEYYDENAEFHKFKWSINDGDIHRCHKNSFNHQIKGYTSLILDLKLD